MEQYAGVQQLMKKEDGQKDRKPVYPPTVIQAVFDGKTGASLEAILAQFNSVYVQYQGTPKDTRLIIPKEMRRAGLTITYMDMDSNTITERANSAVQKDNDHWALDVNWSRVDELSLSGDISVSAKGTWIINGTDTGVKALGPKGDTGLTPWLKTIDNKLHFSYDNVTWEPCSENIAAWFRWSGNKIQVSRDNKTWTDLSSKFADNVHIKGYVANYASLPSGAVQGEIYGVGPTYAAEDTAHTNPIYRYYVRNANSWVDNGSFTSLSAGVVQETGDSETEVMSQKAVSEKFSELGSEVLGEIGYKEQASGNVQIKDLNIKEGTIIKVVVDNGERVYQYFSVVIIENGESKTIAGGITQIGGVYSVDYKTEGVVSLVVVHYTGITVQSPVSLKVINKDSLEGRLNAGLEDADKRIKNLTNEFELEKQRTSEIDNAIKSEVRGRGVFVEDTEGVNELYIFDKSVNITDLHLLYNGGSNNIYSVVFFDGENRIAETQAEKSAIYGIQKIFISNTLGSTDEVIGYIIVDWNAIKTGVTVVIKGLKETCYDVNNSPRIYNFLQSLKMWGVEKDVWKPIKREMFDDLETLKTALNEAFVKYAKLCRCSHYSFYSYEGVPAQLKYILPSINMNFRRKVIEETMTPQEMATAINYALTVPIERFNDAKLYSVSKETDMGWSIDTGMPIGEPSAIVSDDGSTLYVYCGCLYRYKSTDGVNYIKDADLTVNGSHAPMGSAEYLMHCNVNYINGVYYLIGTHGNYNPLVLWTSTDGVNFTKRGTLLNIGEVFNSNGDTIGNFGNTYLIKDSGKWYLYYEITYPGCKDWSNCLATCWNILEKEADGTLGVWTQMPGNPIQDAANTFPLQSTRGFGNIDFARGENNLPIKHDGKYYMYYHGNANKGSLIFRGYSTDLINWTEESMLYNNRDIPTAGATAPGNADHTIIQFKGRTLLFYTYDINDPNNEPVVKLMIDDRPIRELLALMP